MLEIESGLVKVPRFQRKDVWDWKAQRDLLCSIYEGLPIGAILLWQTRLPNIKSRDNIGPFRVPKQEFSPNHSYILDGLQRLTTLYSMVFHPRESVVTEKKSTLPSYEVYCDLEASTIEDKFVLASQLQRLDIDPLSPNYYPMRFVFNSKETMRFQRNISEKNESWIDSIDELVSAFKNYKLPIVPLSSDDQQLATKSFERVNSRGEDMSETHMLNALSYSDKFELLEQIEVYSEKYLSETPLWQDGLDDEFILMAMKLAVGKGPYFKQTDELASLIGKEQVEIVYKAIKRMIDFSQAELFIEAPNAYPYKLQMLGLTYAFMNDATIENKKLKAWYHLTSYYGLFGLTGRVSENALNDLIRFVDWGVYNWSSSLPVKLLPIPQDVNYRSSRAKALLYAMAARLDGRVDSEYRQDIAKKKGRSVSLAKEFSDENRRVGFLFMTKDNDFSVSALPEEELELHFLNREILDLYQKGLLNEFASAREELIFKWEVSQFVDPSLDELSISLDERLQK
nr:DUF262 domain-containing protein [Corallincola luteus]